MFANRKSDPCCGNRDLLSLGWRRGLVVGTCTRSCHIEISLHLIVIRSAVDGRTWIAPRPLTGITVAPAAEPATCTSSTRHTGAGILGSALRNMVRMGRNNHKQSPLYHSLTPGTLVLVPSCRERTLAPLRYPGLEPKWLRDQDDEDHVVVLVNWPPIKQPVE